MLICCHSEAVPFFLTCVFSILRRLGSWKGRKAQSGAPALSPPILRGFPTESTHPIFPLHNHSNVSKPSWNYSQVQASISHTINQSRTRGRCGIRRRSTARLKLRRANRSDLHTRQAMVTCVRRSDAKESASGEAHMRSKSEFCLFLCRLPQVSSRNRGFDACRHAPAVRRRVRMDASSIGCSRT